MITLLLIIPLIGCLCLVPLKEIDLKSPVNTLNQDVAVKIENDSIKIKNNATKSIMKKIALFASLINLLISIVIWIQFDSSTPQFQFVEEYTGLSSNELGNLPLLHLYLGIDGISLYFVLLTAFITPICILSN